MSNLSFGESHVIKGLDAVADAFSGTVYSDVVNLANWHLARFLVHKGVGLLGTSTLTVEACSDAAGNNPTAVPFRYQSVTGADDVPSDVTAAAAAGFATTAGSSQLYIIEVAAQALPAGKPWVRLKAVEVVNDPVLGGILIELKHPRYGAHVPATAIA